MTFARKRIFVVLFILSGIPLISFAQNTRQGIVIGTSGLPAAGVEIRLDNEQLLGISDRNGFFKSNQDIEDGTWVIGFYNSKRVLVHRWRSNLNPDTLSYNADNNSGNSDQPYQRMDGIVITSKRSNGFMEDIRTQRLQLNPTPMAGIESLIKMQIGVSAGNEMSSNYSVRGGNYDENLIYVNDIEILRPQLISSGQQEGLSFINPDLVGSVSFSAGGFGAEYGDKMSSVLDVQYEKPDSISVIANVGTMTNSFAFLAGGKNSNGGLGIRQYSNSLLTRSLNTAGDYSMNFWDAQAFYNLTLSKKWQLQFLGNLATNDYTLNPVSRTTTFGTIQSALQLNVGMAGQESLIYRYGMGSGTLVFKPSRKKEYKLILAHTGIQEQEFFDVQGAYFLSELDRDLGSKDFGKPLRTLGYGYYLDHGRNRLTSAVSQAAFIGKWDHVVLGKKENAPILEQVKFGVRIHAENLLDRMEEWYYNDSADYNVPLLGYLTDSIILDDNVFAKNQLQSYRTKSFITFSHLLNRKKQLMLHAGIRNQYWSVNEQWLWMPRISFTMEPNKQYNARVTHDSLRKPSITYKLAIGAYHQPGFYRELRNFNGILNQQLLAQKSWHLLMGMERNLLIRGQRFKYTSEAYGKYLTDLVPYLYDNIRVRYYAVNSSEGYAWGVDQRLYGEFTKGLESWFTLGIMQTKEKISYTDLAGKEVQSNWLRRPTDRRVNFSAVFQDQLKNNPSVRVNLSLVIGTSIPYYFDGIFRYQTKPNVITPYRRIDLGLSKTFSADKNSWVKSARLSEAWISLDIFNVLDINNVISYSWIKDLDNNRYGVPDYLTGRRLNLRLHARF